MTAQQVLPVLIPLAILAVVFMRARAPRRVRLELLWIAPTLIVALILAGVVFTPHRAAFGPVDYALFAVGAAVGAVVGWWRAKAVRLTVDPATHEVTSVTSPLGLLIIGAVFIVRFGLRSAAGVEAEALRVDPAVIGDAFLLLAAGLVVAQRVEIAVRARRLIAGARTPLGAAA